MTRRDGADRSARRTERARPRCQRPWLATRGRGGRGGLGVEVLTTGDDGPQGVVEAVDQRHPGRDVEPGDVGVADAVEVLDDGPEAVAVGGQEHRLAGLQVGHHVGGPVGQHPRDDVLEALGARQVRTEACVARVTDLGPLVVVGERRGRDVEAAAPEHELLLAVLLHRLLLVLALEGAVVALVEPPAALDRDPVPVGGVERQARGVDGATLHRGVHDVGEDAGLAEELTPADRLGAALVGQRDVDPAGEEVLGVPLALTVAEQDEGVGHVGSVRSWVRSWCRAR